MSWPALRSSDGSNPIISRQGHCSREGEWSTHETRPRLISSSFWSKILLTTLLLDWNFFFFIGTGWGGHSPLVAFSLSAQACLEQRDAFSWEDRFFRAPSHVNDTRASKAWTLREVWGKLHKKIHSGQSVFAGKSKVLRSLTKIIMFTSLTQHF